MVSLNCTPAKTAKLSRGCLETRLRSAIGAKSVRIDGFSAMSISYSALLQHIADYLRLIKVNSIALPEMRLRFK